MSKLILVFLLAVLSIGCGASELQESSSVEWYQDREFQTASEYDIITYGEGSTLKEARLDAKKSVELHLSKEVGHDLTFKLSALKTIKKEQRDKLFYVALIYKNPPLVYRVKKALRSVECIEREVDPFIAQTPIYKDISKTLNCELDMKLERKSRAWYLRYKEHMFLLSSDEFKELFVSVSNNSIKIKASKKVLIDGDKFYFTFNTKRDGYITLLDIYENGIVSIIEESIAIKKTLRIPSQESQNYFEAVLLNYGEATEDLYIAIFTKKPLDVSRFDYINEDLTSNEKAYSFDELIKTINKHEYSSIVLRTKVD